MRDGRMTNDSTRPRIARLVGVYNANGTVLGELAYWVRARLGRAHCALCDITHGHVLERPDWRTGRAGLPVPFDTYHRNDQPAAVRDLIGGHLPAVVAVTDQGLFRLLGPDELAGCQASPNVLVDALAAAADGQGLIWTWQGAAPVTSALSSVCDRDS